MLTPKQKEVLQFALIHKPRKRVRGDTAGPGIYHHRLIQSLVDKGYLVEVETSGMFQRYQTTEAGRKAIEDA